MRRKGYRNQSLLYFFLYLSIVTQFQQLIIVESSGTIGGSKSSGSSKINNDPIQLSVSTKNTIELTIHDEPITVTEDNIGATVSFQPKANCLHEDETRIGIPLEMKKKVNKRLITDMETDLDYIVQHYCQLNVEPLRERVLELGDVGFLSEYQINNDNAILTVAQKKEVKKNNERITFIFSNKGGDVVYHFPWLHTWLPMIQELVLDPLGIPVNQVLRMQLASMPQGADINWHSDKNTWVKRAHRVHIPIITHSQVYFLTRLGRNEPALRIKSGVGDVYEFNNALPHSVRNQGSTRVHLIVDYMEKPTYNENDGTLIMLQPRESCENSKRSPNLICTIIEPIELEL